MTQEDLQKEIDVYFEEWHAEPCGSRWGIVCSRNDLEEIARYFFELGIMENAQ